MFVRFDYPRMMDTMVNNFMATDTMPGCLQYPAVDIVEQENQTTVIAELPGVKKEDVKITFENAVLTISGERKSDEVPENAKFVLHELRNRQFNRSFEFDHGVDAEKISADFNNGILKVTVPKAESSKARTIEVK